MVMQALETSVVRSIDVRVGQSVKKGERLVSLDPTFADADISQVKQRLESLNAEVARLEAEMDGKPYAAPAAARKSKLQADMLREAHGASTSRALAGLPRRPARAGGRPERRAALDRGARAAAAEPEARSRP